MVTTIRIGKRFEAMRSNLRRELLPNVERLSDRELTDGIADFIQHEKLYEIMVRRGRQKKRGGLFD